ncbi:MAG: DUF3108 domain-containing protein [Muribaculaceae bacterium]|nr:DUF3108 domain-containing protein [Muribaculaceae bacterium]
MRKILLTLVVMATALAAAAQIEIPYQEIGYDVKYHWGFMNVNIGHGKVTLQSQNQQFNATLDGNTIPWEGRVFCVSDTLNAAMQPGTPLSSETVSYQNGWYMKPTTAQYREGAFGTMNPFDYKNTLGQGELDASGQTMEAISISTDMLGLFYYFHEIDFDNMAPGQQVTIPIAVNGGDSKSVTITYNGTSSYEAAGYMFDTYGLTFEFTYQGVPSGYPVEAQVAQNTRVPVLLSTSLPIGHVEMIYAGAY